MNTSSIDFKNYLYMMEEASNLYQQLKFDVSAIESGNLQLAEGGWEDIMNNLGAFSDLFDNPDSGAKALVSKIKTDAQTYMEGVNFEIQQPNAAPGNYIPLYELDGQATFGPNGLVWPSKGQANLWEAVSGQLTNLGNDPTDAYWYDTGHGMTYGLGNVDWSQGTTGLNYTSYGDGSGDGERWTIAQGTLTQWAPFIHLDTSHANPGPLTQDLMG